MTPYWICPTCGWVDPNTRETHCRGGHEYSDDHPPAMFVEITRGERLKGPDGLTLPLPGEVANGATPLEEAKRILVASLRDPDQVARALEFRPPGCLLSLMHRACNAAPGATYTGLAALVGSAGQLAGVLREYGGPGCADRIEAAKP